MKAFPYLADKAKHDRMVELVGQMLAARKQLAWAQSDKGEFQPSAFSIQRCPFAALTPAEIQTVEGTTK